MHQGSRLLCRLAIRQIAMKIKVEPANQPTLTSMDLGPANPSFDRRFDAANRIVATAEVRSSDLW